MAVLKAPAKILACYFIVPDWQNGGMRITDIPRANYNQVHIFQSYSPVMVPNGSGGQTANNTGDGSMRLFDGWAKNGPTAAECKIMQDRGQRLVLTLGGANAGWNYQNRVNTQNLVTSTIEEINKLGRNVSGVDFNNFENFIGSSPTELEWAMDQFKAEFGPDFTVTTPVHPNFDARIADRDITDKMAQRYSSNGSFINFPQYYDHSSVSNESYILSQSRRWIQRQGAKQYGVGYAPGQTPIATCVSTYNTLKNEYPDIRGAFIWNASSDRDTGWAWSRALQQAVGNLPIDTTGTTPPPPSPAPPAPSPNPPAPAPSTPNGIIPNYPKTNGTMFFGYSGDPRAIIQSPYNTNFAFHIVPRPNDGTATAKPGRHVWVDTAGNPGDVGSVTSTVFSPSRLLELANAKVRNVVLVGGAGEAFHFNTDTHVTNFMNTFKQIMTAAGGPAVIHGLMFNNFEQLSQEHPNDIPYWNNLGDKMREIARQCHELYGADFEISMAPHPNANPGGYGQADGYVANRMLAAPRQLDTSYPQFYDTPLTASDVMLYMGRWATMMGAAERVGFGYTTRNYTTLTGRAGMSAAVVEDALNQLKNSTSLSNYRGTFIWRFNYDAQQTNFPDATLAGTIMPASARGSTGGGTVIPPAPGPTPVVTLYAPTLNKTPLVYGDVVTVTAIVNTANAALTTDRVVMTVRPPGGTHGGGPFLDFFNEPTSVFPVGNRTYTATYTIPTNHTEGNWEFYLTYLSGSTWYDSPSKYVSVTALPVTPPVDPVDPPPPPPPPPAPVANFVATPRSGNAPLIVSFVDTSTGTNLTTKELRPNGVNTTPVLQLTSNVTYTYPTAGTYSPYAAVTDSLGRTANVTRTGYIVVSTAPAPSPGTPPAEPPINPPVPPIQPAPPPPKEAMVCVQWTNDGVRWSKERWIPAGNLGDYERRVKTRMLGSSGNKGRAFRVRCYDDIDWELCGVYIEYAESAH